MVATASSSLRRQSFTKSGLSLLSPGTQWTSLSARDRCSLVMYNVRASDRISLEVFATSFSGGGSTGSGASSLFWLLLILTRLRFHTLISYEIWSPLQLPLPLLSLFPLLLPNLWQQINSQGIPISFEWWLGIFWVSLKSGVVVIHVVFLKWQQIGGTHSSQRILVQKFLFNICDTKTCRRFPSTDCWSVSNPSCQLGQKKSHALIGYQSNVFFVNPYKFSSVTCPIPLLEEPRSSWRRSMGPFSAASLLWSM